MEAPKKFVLKKKVVEMDAPKKFTLKKAKATVPVYVTALAREVDGLLREWYAALGQTVPLEDLAACQEMDVAEAAEAARIDAAAAAAVPKPVYGTPEFWKAHWAKKRGAACPP